MGGKRKNMSNARRRALRDTGRAAVGKTAVVGIKDRGTNHVRAEAVDSTDADTLCDFVEDNTEDDAAVYTDEAAAHKSLDRKHEAVKHPSANTSMAWRTPTAWSSSGPC